MNEFMVNLYELMWFDEKDMPEILVRAVISDSPENAILEAANSIQEEYCNNLIMYSGYAYLD